jgi:hypothetical protein
MAFNEKYVDAAAAGGGTGTSAADPWTWDEAVANYAAGDRVNVKVGSYTSSGTGSTVGGSLSDPIVFRGYKTTIGDLDGVSLHGLIDGVDIPVIANNTTDNAGIKGSFIYVNNISFTTNRAYSAYVWNFGLYGSVQNCRFVSTSDVASCPVTGYSFFGCYFETKSNYGAIRSATLLESCVIRGNRTNTSGGHQFSDPVGVGATIGPVNNCLFINTSINDKTGTALGMSYPYTGLVSNCTFINWANAINSSTNNPSQGARYICNSYFANCTNAFYDSYRSTGTEPTFHLINNGFYDVTSQANSSVVFNFNPQVDNLDPFVDSANHDYRLTSSSIGYGYSEQRQLAYLNTVNNRDLGALQHADPTLTREKHPLSRL